MLGGDRRLPAVVEVFPHPIHVRLFGLQERIPYKKKQGRSWESCQEAIREYQRHLRTLISQEAPGVLEHPGVQRRLDPAVTESLIGVAYKRLDDALDGLTCAVSAWMMWNEPERWEGIGDQSGCIVVPRDLEWSKPDGARRQPRLVKEGSSLIPSQDLSERATSRAFAGSELVGSTDQERDWTFRSPARTTIQDG